ncbi:hypothetical protein MKQ68_04195 [Chitinophaga horti]|uniref:Outer membrane protein beta-barrel domain-containing protein n=1 Tax=Chitinophaga horti TaxID=2920382 RepID=A0ABY6J7M4_9BACT|nr:hypothetical protein [Chitinophaga horti]UYQ94292.1 hypothetical protein MKQ68_04195 [Chitinophaga horti]
MKKIVLLCGMLAALSLGANAQRMSNPADYKVGLGVRFNPWIVGFTAKGFLKGPHALEGIVHHYFNGGDNINNVTITGLYEYHWNVFGVSEFNMYAGGGAHLAIWERRYYDNGRWHNDGSDAMPGLDGIFGLEYTFSKIPLNLSADLKPYFHFNGDNDFFGRQIGGMSVRYTFK